jgi:hypothetical protein
MKIYTYINFAGTYKSSQLTYNKYDISPFTRRYRRAKEAEEKDDYLLIISILKPTIRRKLKAFALSNV